jgi:hypothetical protein
MMKLKKKKNSIIQIKNKKIWVSEQYPTVNVHIIIIIIIIISISIYKSHMISLVLCYETRGFSC